MTAIVEPPELFMTIDGNVKLTGSREGQVQYTSQPAQVVISELLPDIYGIVICKYDSTTGLAIHTQEGLMVFVVIDEMLKYRCDETELAVELVLYDRGHGRWDTQYSLKFTDVVDFLECVRVLNDGKSKHVMRSMHLQAMLKVVLAKSFRSPEDDA
ncbi:hypothetical protein C8T65DRAFT_738718 [Cerioporus squamosus]|nr:hypothetical protein C8T65DRAFT_738718 [Cerioporus squamosus]